MTRCRTNAFPSALPLLTYFYVRCAAVLEGFAFCLRPRACVTYRSTPDASKTTLYRAWPVTFIGNANGMAVMEFALIMPVLLLLLFGVIDVTRYILIVQKTEKLAHSVANVTAQSAVITQATLNQVMDASSDIMNPFPTGANSHIIVSSLYKAAGASNATVSWRYEGGGTLAGTSRFGAVGAVPTMPVSFTFYDRENVIGAEVYYRFSPLLPNVWFGTTVIYRAAFYSPRFGALTTAPG